MNRPLAVGLGLVLAASVQAQNWPQFRGPNASGVAGGHAAPIRWDAEKGTNILWKTSIPGLAHSSPIVWGDRVFVTTAVSSDPNVELSEEYPNGMTTAKDTAEHSWRLYALNKHTGEVLWERVAHEGVPKSQRHPKSSQASPTPATDGKVIVAFFGSEGLYAYDFDGTLLWKQDLGLLNAGWHFDPDYVYGVASSPIIYEDLVIVQCDLQEDSFLVAFQLKDGQEVWRSPRDEIPSWATPTIYMGKDRSELVTHSPSFIRGVDLRSGEELWRLSSNLDHTIPTPVVSGDLIYVTSAGVKLSPVYAIRPGGTGDITLEEGATSNEFIAWSYRRGGPFIPTPVVYDGYLYLCADNGVLTVYDARTGERIYRARIGGKGGAYFASPIAADGKLYFASEDGDIFVIKTGPKYELLAENPMGEVLMATPAISEGVLYVRGLKHLFAIGEAAASPSPTR